jgi:hypothetical protein
MFTASWLWNQAHLSFEPPPTPVPLLVMETVASSKLHEDAADTIVALERRSEDTKLLRTLMFAVTELSWRRASDRWLQRTPGQLTFRVRPFVGLTAWRVRHRHSHFSRSERSPRNNIE